MKKIEKTVPILDFYSFLSTDTWGVIEKPLEKRKEKKHVFALGDSFLQQYITLLQVEIEIEIEMRETMSLYMF